MKLNEFKLLIVLQFFVCNHLFSQHSVWYGDTVSFVISDTLIRLNATPETAVKSIFRPSDAIDNGQWQLTIAMGFDPSTSNYCRVYLVANDSLLASVTRAYYIECGGLNDNIKLVKLADGSRSTLIEGVAGRLKKPNNIFTVRATRSAKSEWQLFYSDESLANEQSEGNAVDSTLRQSRFVGIECVFTSTRSKLFSFSNISVSGTPFTDILAPQCVGGEIVNPTVAVLHFDEPVLAHPNHFLANQLHTPQTVTVSNQTCTLIFAEPVFTDGDNLLHYSGVSDRFGNKTEGSKTLPYESFRVVSVVLDGDNAVVITTNKPAAIGGLTDTLISVNGKSLAYDASYTTQIPAYRFGSLLPFVADMELNVAVGLLKSNNDEISSPFSTMLMYHPLVPFDVIFTEVMADPTPAVWLPDAEYVEIYNRSPVTLNLKGWKVTVNASSVELPEVFLKSGDYLSLSKFPVAAVNGIALDKFPVIPNDAATLTITDPEGSTIHRFDYNLTMYDEPFKADGGWSLERIDVDNLTNQNNWQASIHPDGGTPGYENSISATLVDTVAPQLLNMVTSSPREIVLYFSEFVHMPQGIFSPLNSTTVTEKEFSMAYAVRFENSMLPDSVYRLLLEPVSDLNGNALRQLDHRFGLANQPDSGNLLINEIMYDPAVDGVEYVELFHAGKHIINSSDVFLTKRDVNGHLSVLQPLSKEPFAILPGSYILLVADKAGTSVFADLIPYPRRVFDVSGFTLPNGGGNIVLSDRSGRVIDYAEYSPGLHSPAIKNSKGVSLGKISPEMPSNAASSWTSASLFDGFGTPGKPNAYSQKSPSETGSDISTPDYFTPDNDGVDDVCFITLKNVSEATVTITVYDANGSKMVELQNNSFVNGNAVLAWDGRNSNGQQCSPGIYLLQIVINQSGKINNQRRAVVLGRR